MKKLVFLGFMLAIGVISAGVYLAQQSRNTFAANNHPYTCQADGTFASLTSGAAAVTTTDIATSAKALTWLKSQTQTETTITTPSSLAPSTEYPASYTGAIRGTFSLEGASYQTKNDAPLTITAPSTVPPTYSGTVEGEVLVTPTTSRWIIQVYKKTANGYVQVPKQALADGETGAFSINLSDVVNPPEGEWAFGILDAENGYTPYGTQWPSQEYYDGLEVQQKLVTDSIYDWSSTRAYVDGTFSFPNSNTGKKLFRLVDTQSGAILAEHVQLTGLIRSYQLDSNDPAAGTAFEDRSFVYDQALALFAAISANDETLATTLVDGLLTLQETSGIHSGGFVFAASQLTPSSRDSLIRTGAHAIATDALLAYIQKYPSGPQTAIYTESAVAALGFLDSTLSSTGTTAGLHLGGYGDYSGVGNSFNPAATISWASTEHNIDSWHTYVRAAKVLGNTSSNYTQKAAALQLAINEKLYNTAEARLNQGMTIDGPDTANPLDVNSWGAIQLYATGEQDKAFKAIEQLPAFQFTRAGVTGYAPFYDSIGYPGAVPNVWFEGSFGVALALLRVGDTTRYRTLVDNLQQAQQRDGSFVYATDPDPTYEIVDRKAVASTAWYILATTGRDSIWNSCTYSPEHPPVVTPPTPPETPTPPSSSNGQPAQPGITTQPNAAVGDITSDTVTLSDPETTPTQEEPVAPNVTAPSTNETLDASTPANEEEASTIAWPLIGAIGIGIIALAGLWWLFFLRRSHQN